MKFVNWYKKINTRTSITMNAIKRILANTVSHGRLRRRLSNKIAGEIDIMASATRDCMQLLHFTVL